ncbi:MAG: TRAM domain-containing protein, partial [Candidatus Kerfeldbacteria bacterium]|nr:TRAM domain-containing protein [Candidatus Kerfeldbacteria bacterium]
ASQIYPDDVSHDEKKRRHEALDHIVMDSALAYNRQFVNQTEEMLVESFDGTYNIGHTKKFMNVRFKAGQDRTGQFAKVKITSAEPWSLEGEAVENSLSP